MRRLVISKDLDIAKAYVNERIFGCDLLSKKVSPNWEVQLCRGDIWTIIHVDTIPSSICGFTIEEVHFMEDLTIKELYSTIDYVAPVLCSSVERGKIFIAGNEVVL